MSGIVRLDQFLGLGAIRRQPDVVAPLLQDHFENFANRGFVVDDQDLSFTEYRKCPSGLIESVMNVCCRHSYPVYGKNSRCRCPTANSTKSAKSAGDADPSTTQ